MSNTILYIEIKPTNGLHAELNGEDCQTECRIPQSVTKIWPVQASNTSSEYCRFEIILTSVSHWKGGYWECKERTNGQKLALESIVVYKKVTVNIIRSGCGPIRVANNAHEAHT